MLNFDLQGENFGNSFPCDKNSKWIVLSFFDDSIIKHLVKVNNLMHKSFCFISEELTHDTVFVHGLLHKLTTLHLSLSQCIGQFKYFSDSCSEQYKNYEIY